MTHADTGTPTFTEQVFRPSTGRVVVFITDDVAGQAAAIAAAQLARQTQSALHVLHVQRWKWWHYVALSAVPYCVLQDLEQAAHRVLESKVGTLLSADGVSFCLTTMRGELRPSARTLIRLIDPTVIVVGASSSRRRIRRSFSHWIVGKSDATIAVIGLT